MAEDGGSTSADLREVDVDKVSVRRIDAVDTPDVSQERRQHCLKMPILEE